VRREEGKKGYSPLDSRARVTLRTLRLNAVGAGLGEKSAVVDLGLRRRPVGTLVGLGDRDAGRGVVRVNSARHQPSIQVVWSSKREPSSNSMALETAGLVETPEPSDFSISSNNTCPSSFRGAAGATLQLQGSTYRIAYLLSTPTQPL
jgi:hypothetical protein